MFLPALLLYAYKRSSGSRAHKKGRAKNYVIHIASGYLAVNIVLEMKSLLVLLFLGAIVATLAEEPFEDEAVAELLDEQGDETIAELADEENDPRRRPRPSGPPRAVRSSTLSPILNRLLGFAQSA